MISRVYDYTQKVGWGKVNEFEKWHHERRRQRMASLTYQPITMTGTSTWTTTTNMTSYPTSNAYTIQTIPVTPGTTNVQFASWNYTDPDYVEWTGQRKAPPREFNRYVNASDLLEEFIAWTGQQGVRKGEFMGLPVESFIQWLIVRACEEDQEEPNVTVALPARRRQPRCARCQRFMPKAITVPLHPVCAPRYFEKVAA